MVVCWWLLMVRVFSFWCIWCEGFKWRVGRGVSRGRWVYLRGFVDWVIVVVALLRCFSHLFNPWLGLPWVLGLFRCLKWGHSGLRVGFCWYRIGWGNWSRRGWSDRTFCVGIVFCWSFFVVGISTARTRWSGDIRSGCRMGVLGGSGFGVNAMYFLGWKCISWFRIRVMMWFR